MTKTAVINHKTEIKTDMVKAELSTSMQIHQSEKQSRRRHHQSKQRKRLSRRRKSIDFSSGNVCNMTITREEIKSGHCSSFGSFCKIAQTETFSHSEVRMRPRLTMIYDVGKL